MTEISVQLHDEEHTKANITQAMRLFRVGSRSEQEFIGQVYSARDIARARGDIRKAAEGDAALRNRAPYFFRVLEDLLSRTAAASSDAPVDEVAPEGRRRWSPEDAERFTTGRYGRLFQN